MQLSVIIVNYNVKHFLEQCLFSVSKAINEKGISGEIIVVDNLSSDGSVDYLKPRFPEVKFILNEENLGFAKACNRGLQDAGGAFILFLNPDTLIPEDCLEKCLTFFNNQPDAGAIGIRMLDGKGRFLKESKRAFPSPETSFFKLSGLARVFPKTKPFANYYLGHLDEHSTHEVDVLAGAFMMIRRDVLDKTGSFDETFFMYGEDIDLSYRIQQSGYKNYYFADSSIIHFKGESTKKNSLNYVRMFYKAMSVFVRKHYAGGLAGLYNVFIQLAIRVSAALSAMGRFIRRIGLPLIDAGLILSSFFIVKDFWENYIKDEIVYDSRMLWIAFPAYTIVYLVTAYYAGLYDRWYKKVSLVRSTAIATLVLLASYAMLPEQYRFSRGIVLFGAIASFILISLERWLLVKMNVLFKASEAHEELNTLIVGSKNEFDQVTGLMSEAGFSEKVLGRLSLEPNEEDSIGYWKDLDTLFNSIPVKEIIFIEGSLAFAEIIEVLSLIPDNCKVKFHASGSKSIVGSDSKDQAGESVSHENGYNLSDPYHKRIKRLIDFSTSLIFLLSFPLHLFFVKKPGSFYLNCFRVLLAQKTWVGYATKLSQLPVLKPSIINGGFNSMHLQNKFSEKSLQLSDQLYAKEYTGIKDLRLIFQSYKNLGN